MVWTELIWLRIGTFRFHRMLGNSLVASQEGFSSMELASLSEDELKP
jgi:hypothetical protein